MLLLETQSIPRDEPFFLELEAGVVHGTIHFPMRLPVDERDHSERPRFPRLLDMPGDEGERDSGVDHSLDQQYVATAEIGRTSERDIHPAGIRGSHLEEVAGERDLDG